MTGAANRRRGHSTELAAHGMDQRYRAGCRCDLCRDANRRRKLAGRRKAGIEPARRLDRSQPCIVSGCVQLIHQRGVCKTHYARLVRTGTTSAGPKSHRAKSTPEELRRTYEQRVFSKIERTAGDCWIWTGATNPGGYGVTWNGTRTLAAHRASYELMIGPIPQGLHLDHLCRNRACINPAHLEAVTQAENNRRSNAIRWGKAS